MWLQIFDYTLDNDTHMFVKWSEQIPGYTGAPHAGIAQDAFVHTVNNEVSKGKGNPNEKIQSVNQILVLLA